jgi:predicted MFS family arabinose efflux permease
MAGWAFIPAQQHRLLPAAPRQATVLLGLNSSAIYLGATIGSILGALTLAFSPAATVSTASAIAAAAAVPLLRVQRATGPPTVPATVTPTGSGRAGQAGRR